MPYSDGKVHVLREQCATCIFLPGNLMHLAPGRLKDVVQGNLDAASALVCHKTIYEDGYTQQAICKGFFEAYKDKSPTLVLAVELGVIEETDGRN